MITYKLSKAALKGTVYPVQVNINNIDTEKLKSEIRGSVGPSAASALDEVIRLIGLHLSEGDTVTLDGLGTFSLRLGVAQNGITEYDDVRSQDIIVKGIRFVASKKLKIRAASQEHHLLRGERQRHKITSGQRAAHFMKYLLAESERTSQPIEQQIFTTKLYRIVTGCTDYTARTELEELVAQGRLVKNIVGRTALYNVPAGN